MMAGYAYLNLEVIIEASPIMSSPFPDLGNHFELVIYSSCLRHPFTKNSVVSISIVIVIVIVIVVIIMIEHSSH